MTFTSPQTYLHLLIALLMLALPGVAVLLALRRWVDKRPAKLLSALLPGTALSIALWPLLLLYVSLIGLRFVPWFCWVLLALAAGYVLYETWAQRAASNPTPYATRNTQPPHASRITPYSLLAITLIYGVFRLWDISGLTVPLFGDSLHHTMITSLIMDGGRVPTGYLPYIPVETFTYHFGFHTLAAVFAMLTDATSQYAVLLLGHVLNTLAVPFAYMLNRSLFGSRLAGLGAALLTASVSLMPAFYVNWGRYTQLSGQLLLMLALVSLIRVMRPQNKVQSPGSKVRDPKWGDHLLLALSVGGLVVVHYRILIFFGLFAVALGAWQLVAWWGKWRVLFGIWGRSIAAMALGLLVSLPWIINLLTNYIRGLIDRLGTVTADYLAQYDNLSTLGFYLGKALPAIALLGLIAGSASLWQSRGKSKGPDNEGDGKNNPAPALPPYAACLVLALWVVLLVASLWPVPGAIGSYSISITLYIPLAALGGYAISYGCGLARRFLRAPRWLFAPLMVVASPVLALLIGTAHVADPATYNYLQGADDQAFTWIKGNVANNAKFLISSEFSYTGRAVTASDAGMWLPLLTGRNVSVPALNSWMERPIERDFFTRTKQLAAYTQPMTETQAFGTTLTDLVARKIIPAQRSLSNQETLDLMRQLGVTHVYVGAYGGRSKPRLDVLAMRKDTQHYNLLYNQDGVYIFEMIY
jgi:hypothetical protein